MKGRFNHLRVRSFGNTSLYLSHLKFRRFILASIILFFEISYATAADYFNVSIDVLGLPAAKIQTLDANQALGYFKQSTLIKDVPGYFGTEAVSVVLDYQDVKVVYQYLTAGGTQLKINIPSLNFTKTFAGITRDDSRHQALDYLKSKGYLSLLLQKMQKAAVSKSANSNVAGNPQSLLANLVQNDFDQQYLLRINQGLSNAEWGAGLRVGGEAARSKVLTPFYRQQLEFLDNSELTISFPLAISEQNEQKSYQVGASASLRKVINDSWNLAGGFSHAVTASESSFQAARYGGLSVTSDFHQDIGIWRLSMGNMIGYYRTYEFAGLDPDLSHMVYRNAVTASRPISIFDNNLRMDYFFIDTHYAGSNLNVTAYQEAGVALNGQALKSSWRMSFNVTSGESLGSFVNLLWIY